jgi:hypothetical protein
LTFGSFGQAKEQRLFHKYIKIILNKIVPIHKALILIHKYLSALELLGFVNEMKR